MINKVFNLNPKPKYGKMPTLTTYVKLDTLVAMGYREKAERKPAVIICPGGGYAGYQLVEGEPVAMQYCNAGIQAFVLDYSLKPATYPEALKELSDAVVLVREHADEWEIDPDKIAVCGFSAGGHLAAGLGVLWNSEPEIKMDNNMNKPDGVILGYPVIVWDKNGHTGSFYNLSGAGSDEAEYEKQSLEKRVDGDTPPMFIWHTFEDSCVPMENSMELACALRKNNIPFELHIYPNGDHGMSLATDEACGAPDSHIASWFELSCEWLKGLKNKRS